MLHRYKLTLLLTMIAGCTRAVPASGPVPTPANSTHPLSATGWRIIPTTEPQEYRSIVNTTLELDSASTRIRDTVTVHARFTLSLRRFPTLVVVSGSVDAFSIEAGSRIGVPVRLTTLPLSFAGRVTAKGLTLEPVGGQTKDQTTDCANPELTALGIVERSLMVIPEELQHGVSWTDSSSMTGCTGSVPVTVISIRTYEVLGETDYAGTIVIALKRTDRKYFGGEGTQGQHRVIMKAEGSGSGVVYVSRITGTMVYYEGEQNAIVTVTSSGLNYRFIQTLKEKTAAVR